MKFKAVEYPTIPRAFINLVPRYQAVNYGNLLLKIQKWETCYGASVSEINPKRARDRINAYLEPGEIQRVRERISSGKTEFSIRFGNKKSGKGYHGDRGDFCVVGGAVNKRNLCLFYRSLELIGGFAYDWHLINVLGQELEIEWKSVSFLVANAYAFAIKRNSNESLYPKILRIIKHE